MNLQDIEVVEYTIGEEDRVARRVGESKEPLVIRLVDGLPEGVDRIQFSDFVPEDNRDVVLREGRRRSSVPANEAISRIANDESVRAFAFPTSTSLAKKVVSAIPLFRHWPDRGRYFGPTTAYFLGGAGTWTEAHYDRELNSNFQLALIGRRRMLLFPKSESRNLYKTPFISNSLVDFSRPLDQLLAEFPRLAGAGGYDVILEPGDMVYMPKQCWHFVEYFEPSAAVTYVFYPRKRDHLLGYVSGVFYMGFGFLGLKLDSTSLYRRFAEEYAFATGASRLMYRVTEVLLTPVIAAVCIPYFLLSLRNRKHVY